MTILGRPEPVKPEGGEARIGREDCLLERTFRVAGVLAGLGTCPEWPFPAEGSCQEADRIQRADWEQVSDDGHEEGREVRSASEQHHKPLGNERATDSLLECGAEAPLRLKFLPPSHGIVARLGGWGGAVTERRQGNFRCQFCAPQGRMDAFPGKGIEESGCIPHQQYSRRSEPVGLMSQRAEAASGRDDPGIRQPIR